MKKPATIAIVLSAVLLGACGTGGDQQLAEDAPIYQKGKNTPNSKDIDLYNPGNNNNDQYGFVRQVKTSNDSNTPVRENREGIQREETANIISKMTVDLPNVFDSSVVVTDKEVLIAYQTDESDDKKRIETADQVKRTAMSVIPRWYNVYVTDDPSLRQNVENIGSMTPYTNNKNETVSYTIQLMLEKSPQGHKTSNNEMGNETK